MNISLAFLYLFPIFVVLIISFIFFSGQIIFTQSINNKSKLLIERSKNDNQSYETSFQLGQMYFQKKNYIQAIQRFYSSSQTWNPNDKLGLACLYNTLGVTYFTKKEYTLSIYYYKQAIELFPNYLTALNNLAFLYEEIKQKNNARELYGKIWKLDKNNNNARNKFQTII